MGRYGRRIDELTFAVISVAMLAAGPSTGCRSGPAHGADRQQEQRDQAELSHGRYLVDTVLLCTNCHSRREWAFYSGPVEAGGEWLGGSVDVFRDGSPAPPISAEDLGAWRSEDLVVALTEGRAPTGDSIHQRWMLPNLAALTSDDASAVARYLKSGPDPTIQPQKLHPDGGAGTGPARGAYLVTIARCMLCHGEDLAGGKTVEVPRGPSSPSANITIHRGTGIGRMSRPEFIDYFKSLSGPDSARVPVPDGTPNTAMPWPQLSRMTREDLGAIYDYIETLPAVERLVGHQ